jgi:DNA-binding HxlR family transcriptional regulator
MLIAIITQRLEKNKYKIELCKNYRYADHMRSYGQLCALAKALDVIGDRWSLLIVRELLPGMPCRYTDLQYGLPGIATNMLAERLRQLEQAGIITREYAPPPVATTVFTLTARGRGLLPVIRELGRWGAPLLADASDDDVFRSGWMALQFDLFYYDPEPDQPSVTLQIHTADQPMVITTGAGKVHARPGTASHPDVTLTGPPRVVIGTLNGRLTLDQALRQGLHIDGQPAALTRIRPSAAPTPARP